MADIKDLAEIVFVRRCVWAGTIIAGQFLFYDLFKNILQVTSEDLTLFLDVLGSIKLAAPDV